MYCQVLGSAAGGGFPQWNCNCPNCDGLRRGSIRASARTQSSITVSDDRLNWVLINASPDVLQQIRNFPPLQPGRSLRDTGIRAIVLMDAQVDHTTGLFMLREHREPLQIWCTEPVREDLTRGNPIFNLLEHYCRVSWNSLPLRAEGFEIPGVAGLRFTALPLSSKAPPYSPHRDDPQPGDNVGLLITNARNDKRLFYAPGLGRMEPHVWQAMQQADCVLVDGTLWTEDEMIRLGASSKLSRDMGHLPQTGPGGMIEWLDQLPKPTRRVLIHINNTNRILDEDSEEREVLASHAIEVAYDGLCIEL
ncbi:MAG: pyrroloquinoline quinone biosynthesis protein PqqB [Lautropia sp.]|nr:pyrroloquinoline quinone biosynthesis protein PqqB [Lautropia sp.]